MDGYSFQSPWRAKADLKPIVQLPMCAFSYLALFVYRSSGLCFSQPRLVRGPKDHSGDTSEVWYREKESCVTVRTLDSVDPKVWRI